MQDKFKLLANMEKQANFPNREDWANNFWKHNYLIMLTAHGIPFAVNADNEQDALDYVIDYCEEHMPGLLMSHEEEKEEKYLDEYICGGNHGRYLNTLTIQIEEI